MKIEDLIAKIQDWNKSLVDLRFENKEGGRTWFTKSLKFETKLLFKDIQTFFDRSEQNDEYIENYKNLDPNKPSYSFLQTEIDLLYSFHKSFATRHKSRLDYYRDDLSQKGIHTKMAIDQSIALFKARKEHIENGAQS